MGGRGHCVQCLCSYLTSSDTFLILWDFMCIYMKSLEGPEGPGGEDLNFLLVGLNWTKFTCDLITKSITLFLSFIQFSLGASNMSPAFLI